MRIVTVGIVLAATCQAQIAFVPSRPGNWTPGKPFFGAAVRVPGDSINARSIHNLSADSIFFEAISLELRSPGLEGEWGCGVGIQGTQSIEFSSQKSAFQRVTLDLLQTKYLAPQAKAYLIVSELYDCTWPCAVDESVTPPDTLFKRNTANPVDTMDVRLGVYWRIGRTNRRDSAYLDCWIEFRAVKLHSAAVQDRHGSYARPPVGSSEGWRIGDDAEGAWVLRRLDGSSVPMDRRATANGLVLKPAQPFAGMGILTNPQGRSYRVVGVR